MRTASDDANDRAYDAYIAARRKFYYWLGGVGYAAYCIASRYLPPDIDSGFLRLLNARGAAIALIVAATGAFTAYGELRRERLRFHDVSRAWLAELAAQKAAKSDR
jgi:hypothetical protein